MLTRSAGWLPYLVEQFIGILRCLGHVIGEHEVRVRLVAQQRGALRAQLHGALHDGFIVTVVIVVAAHCIAFKQCAAHLAIR
jgi:cytochrome b